MEAADLHISLRLLVNIFSLIYERQKGLPRVRGRVRDRQQRWGKPTASSIYATRQNIPVPPQKPDQPRIHKSRLPRDGRGVAQETRRLSGVDGCIGERTEAGPRAQAEVYSEQSPPPNAAAAFTPLVAVRLGTGPTGNIEEISLWRETMQNCVRNKQRPEQKSSLPRRFLCVEKRRGRIRRRVQHVVIRNTSTFLLSYHRPTLWQTAPVYNVRAGCKSNDQKQTSRNWSERRRRS